MLELASAWPVRRPTLRLGRALVVRRQFPDCSTLGQTRTPPFCCGGPRAWVNRFSAQARAGRGRYDDHGVGLPLLQLIQYFGGRKAGDEVDATFAGGQRSLEWESLPVEGVGAVGAWDDGEATGHPELHVAHGLPEHGLVVRRAGDGIDERRGSRGQALGTIRAGEPGRDGGGCGRVRPGRYERQEDDDGQHTGEGRGTPSAPRRSAATAL